MLVCIDEYQYISCLNLNSGADIARQSSKYKAFRTLFEVLL